jgi:hypothetical protein
MTAGSLTLADVAARMGLSVATVEVACNRCGRHGRLSLDRLIADHGAAMPVPALRRIVAADCARMVEGRVHDPCGVHFPDLSGLFVPAPRLV